MERLFNVSAEEQEGTSTISKDQKKTDRREKIAKFLKNQKEKRMNAKVTVEKQLVNIAREDLALKRKIMETSEKVDEQFLSNNSKMTKTMENVGNAITCCFEMMKKMYETPPKQQQSVSHDNFQQRMPTNPEVQHSVHQFFPSNCFNTSNFQHHPNK